VALSRDIIKPLVVNQQVINTFIGDRSRYKNNPPEGFSSFIESLSQNNCIVSDVQVKGKFMYWTFSNGWSLLNTFGMSGQWSPKEGKHPCFGLSFNDNSRIYFNDPRHFGTIKLSNNPQDLTRKLSELGWDPLTDSLPEYLPWMLQTLRRTKKQIGEVLLDQSIFAGVGNYIRSESLYKAKLNPFKISLTLTESEVKTLCQAVIDVMQESYQFQGGASFKTHLNPFGDEGKYSSCFKVYMQKQDPAGNQIITQDLGGRTMHWCPTIQQ
jgi:formamidopyrimidine-DNA glycosylase